MSSVADIVHALTEGDEEDFKDIILPSFSKGSRIKVMTGCYAGEIGTVESPTNVGDGEIGYWVHLDNCDDPDAAIIYRAKDIDPYITPSFPVGLRVRNIRMGDLGWIVKIPNESERWVHWDADGGDPESMARHTLDEIEAVNESVAEALEDDEWSEPNFSFVPVTRDSAVSDIFVVLPDDRFWIGRVHFKGSDYIVPMWAPKKFQHEQPRYFTTTEEAAKWFWQHWDLANVQEQMVKDAVAKLTEANDDDDESWVKDTYDDTLSAARNALELAGYAVKTAELQNEGMAIVLVFTWARPTAKAYVGGAQRAFEILTPIIGTIKKGDYRTERYLGDLGEEVQMRVSKRLENDPSLWRIVKDTPYFKILFNGEEMGEVYAGDHFSSEENAERVRREMLELHRILPFYQHGWKMVGNEGDHWGRGPAVAWWRAHRTKLPMELRVGEHFLDKNLLTRVRA